MDAFYEPCVSYGSVEFPWPHFCQEADSNLASIVYDGEMVSSDGAKESTMG